MPHLYEFGRHYPTSGKQTRKSPAATGRRVAQRGPEVVESSKTRRATPARTHYAFALARVKFVCPVLVVWGFGLVGVTALRRYGVAALRAGDRGGASALREGFV